MTVPSYVLETYCNDCAELCFRVKIMAVPSYVLET